MSFSIENGENKLKSRVAVYIYINARLNILVSRPDAPNLECPKIDPSRGIPFAPCPDMKGTLSGHTFEIEHLSNPSGHTSFCMQTPV
jgi:hypothetical protein